MNGRLRESPAERSTLVERTATALGLPPAYVEKDFWVTEVLRVASSTRPIPLANGVTDEVSFLFKGGTSLSRVFGLIERFSEDVDLLAIFPDGTGKEARHRVLKSVDSEVSAHLSIAGEVVPGSSDTGVKRYTTYTYPARFGLPWISSHVLLELGSRGGIEPASINPFRSMVAEHALAAYGEDESVWEEFAPFDVLAIAPERTLLEKVAGVHAAASGGNTNALLKAGRHFYDIGQLLNAAQVTDALRAKGSAGIADLVADIDAHSTAAGFLSVARPSGGYADSPAFDPTHPSHEPIARGYHTALDLVQGPKPTLDDVLAVVQANRDLI